MRHRVSNRTRVAWGVALIALGVLFLLRQMGALDWLDWRPMWPSILIVIGLVWMVAPNCPRQIASGVTFVLLGLWFYACIENWHGLTYDTAWPLLLVVGGLRLVLIAVLDRFGAVTKEERHA